jgi:hypothetical protein
MTPLGQAAAVVLARVAAEREVRRRIKKAGRNPSLIPAARIARLGNEWLEEHPELIAEALADPILAALSSPPLPRRGRKAATIAGSGT